MKMLPARKSTTTLLLAAGMLGTTPNASASILLEPAVGGGMGSSSILGSQTSSSSTFGFGGTLRAGIEANELFVAVEPGLTLVSLNSGQSGSLLTAGVAIGGNFKYLPLRAAGTFQFLSRYSDSTLTMNGGFAFRLSLGYFLSETVLINAIADRIIFTGLSGSVRETARKSASYSQVGLSVSMPLYFEQPTVPWKTRYRQRREAKEPQMELQMEPQPESEQLQQFDQPTEPLPQTDAAPQPDLSAQPSTTEPVAEPAPELPTEPLPVEPLPEEPPPLE